MLLLLTAVILPLFKVLEWIEAEFDVHEVGNARGVITRV
jgi:hypothetical protein